MAVRCPFGCRPELGGPWVPAFAGKTMREFSARLGPPRFSDSSALSLRFPRESGIGRASGRALPREWISAQWIFRRHDAWVLVKRRHLLCCGGHGGSMRFWLPSRARWSLGPGVRWEDDERVLRQIGPSAFFRFLRALPSFPPRKRDRKSLGEGTATGMDLSAVDIPPARCLGARETPAPSVLRRPWRVDALLVAVQSSVVPGSRRSLGRR